MYNKTITIGEACTLVNGYAFKPSDWKDEGLPIIRIQNLNDPSAPFNYFDGVIPEKYFVHSGDLLFSWSGTPGSSFGAFIWDRGEGVLNQHIFNVYPSEGINKRFFLYAMNGRLQEMIDKAHGGVGLQHITKKELESIEVYIPDPERQTEIVRILDMVSSIIDDRKEQLTFLDELVKSRFIEMFGDLKANTKGWPVALFTDFAEIDGNMTTDYEKYANYPHIGIDSIEKGTGALKGYRTVKEDGVISGKYIFTSKHIIYSKIRPNLNKVALPTFEGLCSADAYPILPNSKNCNRVFLAFAMRSEYFLEYILQFSSRTNLPKVNRKEITGFRMPLPPLELQRSFAAFVAQTDKSKYSLEREVAA